MKLFKKEALTLSICSIGVVLAFQNCGNPASFNQAATDGSAVSFASKDLGSACFFDGQEIQDGAILTAYQNSTVPSGQACVSETRVCRDGNLSGSYNYNSCQPGGTSSCLFAGHEIPDGGAVQAFLNAIPAKGAACQSETRVCHDGILSGSYNSPTCTPGKAACIFNGRIIQSGDKVLAFLSSTAPSGQACVSEERTCDGGVLSGSYTYPSCAPEAVASCQFNGQTIASGEIYKAFPKSTVPYGQLCSPENRVCANGVLSGSAQFSSCSVGAPAACVFNNQTVAHGQNVTAFVSSTVPFGQTCTSQIRSCNNGTLSGNYTYADCSVGAPASCNFNGQTIPHGGTVTAYAVASVVAGSSCAPQAQTRSCNNGVLSGSYGYASCAVMDGLVSSNVTVSIRCSIDAANSQTLVITLKDGSTRSWNFGNSSPAPFSYVFPSSPVAFQAYSNGSLSATRYANQTTHTLSFQSEDGTDGDYNDLMCSFSW